jgi:type III secretory pathway component EscU
VYRRVYILLCVVVVVVGVVVVVVVGATFNQTWHYISRQLIKFD